MSEPVTDISSFIGLVTGEVQNANSITAPVAGDDSEFALLLSKYIGAGTSVLTNDGNRGEVIAENGADPPESVNGLQEEQAVLGKIIRPMAEEFPLRNFAGLDEEVILPVTSTGPQVPATAVLPTVTMNAELTEVISGTQLPGNSINYGLQTASATIPEFTVGGMKEQPLTRGIMMAGLTDSKEMPASQLQSIAIRPSAEGQPIEPLVIQTTGKVMTGNASQELLIEKSEISQNGVKLLIRTTAETNPSGSIKEQAVGSNSSESGSAAKNAYSHIAQGNQSSPPLVRVHVSEAPSTQTVQPKFISLSERLVDQVIQRLSLTKLNERSEIRIKLQPEVLGDLRIKVSFENGTLSAKLVTGSMAVKESLETGLTQLRHSLNSQGFDVQNLSVSLNDNRHSEHGNLAGYKQNRFSKEQDDSLEVFKNTSEVDETAEQEYAVNWLV